MSFTRTFIIAFVGLLCTFSGGGLFAQNAWETLPVFHNGRVMPLHTFARKIVRDTCGTERPFIVRDNAVIDEFNRIIEAFQRQSAAEQTESSAVPRFFNPGTTFDGGFNRSYSPFNLSRGETEQFQTALLLQGHDRVQIERIVNRIRELIPLEGGGRYFSADELLFSWICEPEVWIYIPLFRVADTGYLVEMFGEEARNSQNRVSLHQLANSTRFRQRLADIQRRHAIGQFANTPDPFDVITEELAGLSKAFQDLTFHPQRQRPTRMLDLLYQTAGLTHETSSLLITLDAWGYLLELGEVPGRRSIERTTDPEDLLVLHPTTQRWHDIADKLLFLIQTYDRTDHAGNPILPRAAIVEQHFEILIDLIDTNLAEAAALMETLYPGTSYRLEGDNRVIRVDRLLPRLNSPESQRHQTAIRRIAISYYFSVKTLRKEVEAAYLALYDNGLSFRFLPVQSPLVLALGSSENTLGVQPWASAAMVLGSGEAFIKRFFDPQFTTSVSRLPVMSLIEASETAVPAPDETMDSDTSEMPTEEENGEEPNVFEETVVDVHADQTDFELMEQLLFQAQDIPNGILRLGRGDDSPMGAIRTTMRAMLMSYSAPIGGGYGNSDFVFRAQDFQQAVYRAVIRIESQRQSFVDESNKQMVEHLVKTAYPDANSTKLRAEFRYDRLRPFFWMWVFALAALLLSGAAYVTAIVRRGAIDKTVALQSVTQEGELEESELSDYTNTLEEWFFFGSVAMLTLSMLIALLGGWMRASISGWAPVTNMYETVVMTALAAAIIGVWYGLYPLLQPALRHAWLQTKFPRPSTLMEWLAALKTQKAIESANVTEGEAAMREAAKEFGVLGGTTLGGQSIAAHLSPAEMEAQRRVQAAQRKMTGRCLLAVPRLILTCITFYAIVMLANGDYVAQHSFTAAAINMFATEDIIDWLTVVACVLLMIWFVPHALLALVMMPVVLCRPAWIAADEGIRSFEARAIVDTAAKPTEKPHSVARPRSEMSGIFQGEGQQRVLRETADNSGAAWYKLARNAVLDRKLFIVITASVVFIVGLVASLNRAEFNPDIRPIAAVLRSNFWLAVHVMAIIVSYAAAFIAWGMAAVSLGYLIFGRYQRTEPEFEGQRPLIVLPATCQLCLPVIERLLNIALLLLIIGTVLGARWADYSWGRFWSWDPKEVWALITILFLVIVLHGKIARHYGAIGIFAGALFASIAVIITWYGINYVFIGGRHTYGGGTASSATLFMWIFIAANLFWGALALLRYNAEAYGSDAA